ncbi:MAG: glycosyl transferase [Arcobacter sp.]|nr:glycosyl transferase [Arcobacter sp.]
MNLNNPLVSVIMPVFNGEKYLEEAINSIIEQTYKNIELIILDDGSTDNSINVINKMKNKSTKINYKPNEKNIGVSATRNRGMKIAKGKYIAFMDADDISPLYRIEKQVEFLENNKDYGLAGGHYESFTNYGFFTKRKLRKLSSSFEHIKANILFSNSIACSSVMLRKKLIHEHNLFFNESLRMAEDLDLWRRISKVSKLINLDMLLIHYRKHNNNSIKKKDILNFYIVEVIKSSLNDFNIASDELFDHDNKFKSIDSFKELNKNLENILEENKTTKIYNQVELEKSCANLLFWIYKKDLNIFGFKLYNEYKKMNLFNYTKLRTRDKINLIKYF